MKNVWILNHYAQIPGGAGGTRHFHLAEYLRRYGWNASVIAASVELNTGRQRLAPGVKQRIECVKGIPFLWVRTPEYSGNGGGRMMNMLSYSWKVLLRGTTRDLPRPDAIIGSSVHPFAAVAAAFLAKRYRVPFVFEVRDLWPQTLIDMGRLKERSITASVMRALELWLYRRAERIITLLPKADEYIVPLGISKDKITWIPNGVDLSLFPTGELETAAQDDEFTLMYFGAHGQANGLADLMSAFKLVEDNPRGRRIRLRLIGDGPLKLELIAQARDLGLRNVSFEPPVGKSEIPALASEADEFVITVLNLPRLYRYGISMNKLFDYLAASRPIVIASDAANDPVREAGAGITVAPGDPAKLAEAILRLSEMSKSARNVLGAAGRKYVEVNHGFDHLAGRLAKLLDSVSLDRGLR